MVTMPTLLVGLFGLLLASAPAQAQATRTWVSGVGDDANPCSRTAPCKTFAGAISKTVASGEIDCLDPGGFGAITITKAITLNCSATLGSILVAGTNAINISAGSTDRIVLRNIQLQGTGPGGASPGLAGISINSAGVVVIENCVVTQFSQQGIKDVRTGGGSQLLIRNTVVTLNGGPGIVVAAAATSGAELENIYSAGNSFGLAVGTGSNVVVKRSVFSGNATAGVEADPGSQLIVDDSAISRNGTGVLAAGAIRVSNSDIDFNSTAFSGPTTTYGNNRVFGNAALGTTPTAAGAASNNLGEQ
jgi:hypothetical protein